jgi:hypothetical protein
MGPFVVHDTLVRLNQTASGSISLSELTTLFADVFPYFAETPKQLIFNYMAQLIDQYPSMLKLDGEIVSRVEVSFVGTIS